MKNGIAFWKEQGTGAGDSRLVIGTGENSIPWKALVCKTICREGTHALRRSWDCSTETWGVETQRWFEGLLKCLGATLFDPFPRAPTLPAKGTLTPGTLQSRADIFLLYRATLELLGLGDRWRFCVLLMS